MFNWPLVESPAMVPWFARKIYFVYTFRYLKIIYRISLGGI